MGREEGGISSAAGCSSRKPGGEPQVVSHRLKRYALQRRHRQGEAERVRAALTAGAGEDGGGGAEGVVSIGNKGT